MKNIHRFLAYGLIITSQVTILEGVIEYNVFTSDPTLGYVNIGCFLFIWGGFETFY